jgi:acyl-CoA dehydrogenase
LNKHDNQSSVTAIQSPQDGAAQRPDRWPSLDVREYLIDPAARELADFFAAKGLASIKHEDRREQWYADWIAYQSQRRLYARLLTPKEFSTLGAEFNLPRYARFLELFAYFSPAHGYSLQVTFLGLFPILMGSNVALKREAIAALESGAVFALGVSEKQHGADLLASEFTVTGDGEQKFFANGRKYYIGNCNAAAIISILARKQDRPGSDGRKRAPFMLFALRPQHSPGFRQVRKINTMGVRAAYVGEFEVKDHPVAATDLIADGRDAWDAVLGTVTMGKFFLGFGAIGICEHAMEEAALHLSSRVLYAKPAIEMPHLRRTMAEAYARIAAMKLYAYRALDYVRAAHQSDRRYVLYCAVQKAKVSTEAVKVMALLSECVGARGFEADTYFEMALRDVQLFPGVEGSTHINLALAAQVIPRYFSRDISDQTAAELSDGSDLPNENAYLMQARSGSIGAIAFRDFLAAYSPLTAMPNVRRFVRQATRLGRFFRSPRGKRLMAAGSDGAIEAGKCLAIVAYAQLIAESCASSGINPRLTSMIFGSLICDLSSAALSLASSPHLSDTCKLLLRRIAATPHIVAEDLQAISQRIAVMPTSPKILP